MMELCNVSDHALLAGGLVDAVAENRAAASRWARLVEFFRRRQAAAADGEGLPHFGVTPRQETVVEVAELWGWTDQRVRSQLNVAMFLQTYFAQVWDWCQAGQIDAYRAQLIGDTARLNLDAPEQWHQLAERITPFLAKSLATVDGFGLPPWWAARPSRSATN